MGGISKGNASPFPAGSEPGADSAAGAGARRSTANGGSHQATGAGSRADSAGAESVAGMESVGVADAERLVAEAEAAAATLPADELSAQIEGKLGEQASQLTSWSQITGDGVDIVAVCFLPQWHLSDAERKRLSERLSRMLDLLCPVRMSPVIEAVVGVGLCAGGIVASRAMTNGGRLPPLGPPKPAPKPAPVDPLNITSLTE